MNQTNQIFGHIFENEAHISQNESIWVVPQISMNLLSWYRINRNPPRHTYQRYVQMPSLSSMLPSTFLQLSPRQLLLKKPSNSKLWHWLVMGRLTNNSHINCDIAFSNIAVALPSDCSNVLVNPCLVLDPSAAITPPPPPVFA